MSAAFFSFFWLLPIPLKILAVVMGGFAFLGFKNARVEAVQQMDAQIERKEAVEPVAPNLVVPVKPAVAQPAKKLVITVNSDGSFNLDGAKLTSAQLETKLKAISVANPGSSVSLRADALTPHQMVVSGVNICKKAGIINVTFASKVEKP
jgi:biopolymer transport protein ExbD